MSTTDRENARSPGAGFRITAEMAAVLRYLAENGPSSRGRIVTACHTAGRHKQAAYKTVYDLERKRLIEPVAPNAPDTYQVTDLGKTILTMTQQG